MAARRKLAALAVVGAALVAAVIGFGGDSEPRQCGSWGDGDITFATGVDQSVGGGLLEKLVRRWERKSGKKVKLVSLPPTADGQRSQMVATAQARSPDYDVLGLDVIFTAEFASRGYVERLDGRFDQKGLEGFLRQPLETAKWDGKLWGVPLNTNVGLLFYRDHDAVSVPENWTPNDWHEVESKVSEALDRLQSLPPAESGGIRGFAGQFRSNEGLTVNALEAIWGEGGDLLADGKAVVNPDAVEDALARLQRGFRPRGWIDSEALGYSEQETLTAFQDGRVLFMRNWPYAYLTLKAPGSGLRDEFEVAPLPNGGALGGQNLAIAACSDDKATARDFIEDFTGEANQRELFEKGGYPPTRGVLYRSTSYPRDSPVRGLAPTVKEALDRARLRPQQPGYIQASEIVQRIVGSVIRNKLKPADAIKSLEKELSNARLD